MLANWNSEKQKKKKEKATEHVVKRTRLEAREENRLIKDREATGKSRWKKNSSTSERWNTLAKEYRAKRRITNDEI